MAAGLDYPDFTAPQAHADAIAATGTPALTLMNGVQDLLVTVAAGASHSLPNFVITQPAYELFLNAFSNGAGAAGPLEIRMQWYEDTATTFIDEQDYWVWPGSSSLGSMLVAKGPTRGGILSMTMINHSAAMSYSLNTWLFQRSHYYVRDDWRHTFLTNSASGLAVPTSLGRVGMLCETAPSVPAGSNTSVLLPMYTGMAQLYADTTSNTTDLVLRFQNSTESAASSLGTRIQVFQSDASGRVSQQFQMPRYQLQLEIDNNNAAAKNVQLWLHAIE